MIKKLIIFLGITFALVCTFAVITMADTVDISVSSSDGYDASILSDDDYTTNDYYKAGTVLTVTSSTPMEYLYIMWDTVPGSWTLGVNGTNTTCGAHGFLHELVKLPSSATTATITIVTDNTYVANIYGIAGDIPSWVQDWQDPYDETDILFISTHSDDEILFMGAAMATYVNAGYRVEVAYMCNLELTEKYRQHEQLNGLWAMGLTHYPQMGEFLDDYPDDEDAIYDILDYDEVLSYMVRTIRRFKPQVIITHDIDGEYGHPEHKMCARAVTEAVTMTADAAQDPDSAATYGTWDVPKTYLHLYADKQIQLDCRVPLEKYGGKTAYEVAADAYLEHQSQQWMWFYVSDGYNADGSVDTDSRVSLIDCSLFGLYRTTVGDDTGNDMMEHITAYDVQEAQTQTPETASSDETEVTDGTSGTTSAGQTTAAGETTTQSQNEPSKGGTSVIKVILIIAAIIVGLLIIIIIVLLIAANIKRKKEAERRRRRRAAQQRRRNQK